jgi:beta-fructofuranosidase
VVQPRAAYVTARLERGTRLRLLTSADGGEYLDLVRDPATGELLVDRDHASRDPRGERGRWRLPPEGEPVEVRMLIGRRAHLTLRFYPSGDGPWRLSVDTAGDGRAAYEVRAWGCDRRV